MYNVARRILKDESEAEDLVQELFLFIFQKAPAFDAAKASGASWVIQMAYHRAIDRRRYLGFRQHYNTEELNEERLMVSRGQISIDELAGRALLNRLRDELSADQRQASRSAATERYWRLEARPVALTYGMLNSEQSFSRYRAAPQLD